MIWGCIPVHALLHHTSGLPDYLLTSAPAPADAAGFLALCHALEPFAPAGACWSYSNTNYILLGLIAARVGGGPAGVQMQALLEREGAGSARIASPDWVRQSNAQSGPDRGLDHLTLTRDVIGDGDIAFDLASATAWMKRLLRPPDRWRELYATAPTRAGAALYGAGFFVEPFEGRRFIHHAGHFDGWTAALVMNVERGVGAVAMCDGAPGHTRFIRRLALSALEEAAPGATPLALGPMPDPHPDLTAMIRRQLLRGAEPLDPSCFAEAMAPLVAMAPFGRGIVNLGLAGTPRSVALVDRREAAGETLLRYRIDFGGRLEHLTVGVTPDAKIFWAWPI